MPSDVEIARQFSSRSISEIAASLAIGEEDLLPCGRDMAKVHLRALTRPTARSGRRYWYRPLRQQLPVRARRPPPSVSARPFRNWANRFALLCANPRLGLAWG